MSFSERYGYKPVRETLQVESMDDALRNGLWSILTVGCWDIVKGDSFHRRVISEKQNKEHRHLCEMLWINYFKLPIDQLHHEWTEVRNYLYKYFFNCPWYEVYDFIEFVAHNYQYPKMNTREQQVPFLKAFTQSCNGRLEIEMSAYRFVNGQITRITNDEEIEAIEQAASNNFSTVSTHINRSLALLSDRETPDYRNSIKESISAVESLAAEILEADKGTLGQLIKQLETKIDIHPALKDAFSKLYGYTSDANGIRHALMEKENTDFHDAKFMLVTCSAFINYVDGKLQE